MSDSEEEAEFDDVVAFGEASETDDDENDVPLSALAGRAEEEASEEASEEATPRRRSRSPAKKRRDDDSMDGFIDDSGSTSEESYAESDDASERRVKTPPPSKKASKEKSSKKKKRRDSSARKSSSKKPKKSAPVAVATQAAQSRTFPTPSSVMYAMTAKGKLIQQLLCRWWYVTVWPDPASIPRTAPPNYDRLDGFPGVFICSSGDDIGKMMDFRDKSAAPCFVNMSHRSSEDLKALLLEALEKQEEELLRHEEAENEGMAKIKELRKWAKKVDPDKADREAKKILRAHNMVLAPMLPAVETSNTF